MKLVIVGGVAGGASAAARARRLDERAEIVVFERGPDPSFANCGLPYYVGGEIRDRTKLLVTSPEVLKGRYNLDVRTDTEVVGIDRDARTVTARRLADGTTYVQPYDALILAPGAEPLRPSIPGIDLPGVFTLRNLPDVDRIKAAVDRGSRRATLVGAGFIGLELAENLVRRGVETTLVELQDQVLPPLDREMTTPLVEALGAKGVVVRLRESAEAIRAVAGGLAIDLRSGGTIEADLVVLGVGVRPENALAKAAGLEIGQRGGIRVDDRMRTSDPAIFAVGDAVEIRDFVSGAPAQVPLAGPANRQGRIAADNVFGRESRYRGTQGTAIVGFFGHAAAITGASEKALRREGRSYQKIYVHANQHASYYPGARPMTIKLLFEGPSGRILGAQVVGEDGVDNRVNVIATAIQAGMTVFDLEEVELAYAPQFGSAKDAINMAGFVASNVLRGDVRQVHVDELDEQRLLGAAIIDVRTPKEFAAGRIEGAVNIPLEQLRTRIGEVPRDRPVVVHCQVGMRGYMATRILRDAGLDSANLAGGYKTYRLYHPECKL
ncbi:Coenzyme A disulfide reductase [Aquisphaera giovannonii]|uniref:Coenzyme A disulfide reductase n=1 Tax=Aquisphaera giovannonii TaxID=406548 RepID=A0A5B9W110_9BACT|nr:FAD-dependent oxidoreductase [Aquisphaera giovannonii]QEH33665.1 Coenzyme A disulfide reductase [Aquisphaera giovannonii]